MPGRWNSWQDTGYFAPGKLVISRLWNVSTESSAGAASIGVASTMVGIAVGATVVSFLLPLPERFLSIFDYAISLRAPVVLIAILAVTTLFVPRLNVFWCGILPGALVIWLALNLYLTWRLAPTTPEVLAGRLPWQDGSHYLADALSLLNGGPISAMGERRPFNVILLALRLYLANRDLLVALAIGAAAVSISILLAAREVSRTLGIAAATAFAAGTAGFITATLTTMESEPQGLFLGTLAFACLWRSAAIRSIALYGVGMLLLTTALMVRIGPVFILPFLLLWGAFTLGKKGRWSWFSLAVGIAACVIGGLFPMIYNAIFGAGTGQYQANFAYTLYGMAVGGDWTTIIHDHPELFNSAALSEAQRSHVISQLALKALISDPVPALSLIGHDLIRAYPFAINLIPTWPLRLLGHIGVLLCLGTVRHRISRMLLFSLLGIVFSGSLLITHDGSRVFAAVVPFVAAYCAVGVVAIVRIVNVMTQRGPSGFSRQKAPGGRGLGMAAGYTCALIGMAVAPLLLFSQRSDVLASENARCPADMTSLTYVPNKTGTGLKIRDVPAGDRRIVSWHDFERDPEFKETPKLSGVFKTLRPPLDLLLTVRNRPSGPQIWFVLAEGTDLPVGNAMTLCGEPVPLEELPWDNLWHDRFMRLRLALPLND